MKTEDLLHLHLAPRQARATVTGDTTAQKSAAATQGQFNSLDATTPIVDDGTSHKIAVKCFLANLYGRVDPTSMLEIVVEAGQNLSAPTAVTGTLLGGAISTVRGVFFVRPDATGYVSFTVTLAAGDTPKVTLKHRHYVSTTAVPTIA